MNTATQTTKKAKSQLPPDMLLVDSTAQRAKAMREAQAATRGQTAIQMALNLISANFRYMSEVMQEETKGAHEDGLLDALNLVDMGSDKLSRMRSAGYRTLDDVDADLLQIGSLMKAISIVYGKRDTVAARTIKSGLPYVDTMLAMIDLEEMAA